MTITDDIKLAGTLLQLAMVLEQSLVPAVEALYQTVVLGTPLTADQRATLLASNAANSAALQAPLAPESDASINGE